MGNAQVSTLYWLYLLLAITVGVFSFIYWVYKFANWWQRRQRRLARRMRSLQEQQERLAVLQSEREQVAAQGEHVRQQIASAGMLSRWLRKGTLLSKLKDVEQRTLQIDQEIGQIEEALQAELERVARPSSPKRAASTGERGASAP
jgi:chromosome segregation ATPase